jgi:hypothetical protein
MLRSCLYPISFQIILLKVSLLTLICCSFAINESFAQESPDSCGIVTAMLRSKFASTILRLDQSHDPSIRFLDWLHQLKGCSIDSTFGKPVIFFEGPFDTSFRQRQMDIIITLAKSEDFIQIHYQQLGTGQVGTIYLKKNGNRFKIVKWRHIVY